jgi:hypothetical protein
MLDIATWTIFEEDHHQFRDAVRKFFTAELLPNSARWDENELETRRIIGTEPIAP